MLQMLLASIIQQGKLDSISSVVVVDDAELLIIILHIKKCCLATFIRKLADDLNSTKHH